MDWALRPLESQTEAEPRHCHKQRRVSVIFESSTKPWVFWGILVLSVYSAGCPGDPRGEYVVDGSILSDGGETWRWKASGSILSG